MTVNVRVRGRLDTTVEANDGQEKYGPLRLGDYYTLGLSTRGGPVDAKLLRPSPEALLGSSR